MRQAQVSADHCEVTAVTRFLWASCVGVSVPAVSVSDQLSFLAGVRRLLNDRSLNVCRETNTNKRFGFIAVGAAGRPLTHAADLSDGERP